MTRESSAKEMEKVRGDVERRVWDASKAILALAEAYRYLGKTFTFSFNDDLDAQVNSILLELSDDLMADNNARVMQTISDAEADLGEVEEYVDREQGGKDRTERYDWWCSRLRDSLELWARAGFACGLAASAILSQMRTHSANPSGSGLWARSGIQPPQGFGQGLSSDIIGGLTLTGQNSINEAFQYAALLELRGMGDVTGYRVVRGSSFDCGHCDDLCVGIHPLTEICLPAHPRCMCRIVPVTRGEEQE